MGFAKGSTHSTSSIQYRELCVPSRLGADGNKFLKPTNHLQNRSVGQISVKPLLQKYSDLQNTQIRCLWPRPVPQRGARAIVTNAGRDAMDVESAYDRRLKRTAKSCGPDASWLASSRQVFSCG